MGAWLLKILGKWLGRKLIKTIKYKIDLKRIDKYVNKPNELDIQVKQLVKTNSKILRENEEMQKNIAILRKESHPPIFSERDKKKIWKSIRKLEKKEK